MQKAESSDQPKQPSKMMHEAIASKMVKQLQAGLSKTLVAVGFCWVGPGSCESKADLTATKEQAETDHQARNSEPQQLQSAASMLS